MIKLKKLHVLDLSRVYRQELSIPIDKLIHLRYLDLSGYYSKTLLESICKLYNLQTLRLSDFTLNTLPEGIGNLIRLRHLHHKNDCDHEEFRMPRDMGRLTCLQTLEFFKVDREKGRRIGELGCLKNLKGGLDIHNLALVKGREEAKEANLFEKTNLLRLSLLWDGDWEGNNCHEDVLDGLRPHPNLEELKICEYKGDQFPRWLMDLPTTLPKLVSFTLRNCIRCRELPLLKNLKELYIVRCNGLTNLPGDMLQFCTSLQKLWVNICENLISFPLDLQQTPSLSEISLIRCTKLRTSMTPKGFDFLTNLRTLWIGPFLDDDDDDQDHNSSSSSVYKEFDWSGLISSSSSTLRELDLYGLPHIVSLPHQLQYLTTLTSLRLYDFGGIEALPDWFRNFAALEELLLFDFERLGHLPSEDAMRRLTKLGYLEVDGSPLSAERCSPESTAQPDSQWSKVSHIPQSTPRYTLSKDSVIVKKIKAQSFTKCFLILNHVIRFPPAFFHHFEISMDSLE